MADDQKKDPPRRQMTLGGQVLYDSEEPLSDDERGRRIRRALRNVGWKRGVDDRAVPVASGVAQAPKPPGRIVSGELLP
jgi:hypothetical protein